MSDAKTARKEAMNGIELVHATIGTVSSREDGSVAFRVITAELRPSEAGLVLQYHGKACAVTIKPHEGTPDKVVTVATERGEKTPGQRLHAVLFVLFKQTAEAGEDFESFYKKRMEEIITGVKSHLAP